MLRRAIKNRNRFRFVMGYAIEHEPRKCFSVVSVGFKVKLIVTKKNLIFFIVLDRNGSSGEWQNHSLFWRWKWKTVRIYWVWCFFDFSWKLNCVFNQQDFSSYVFKPNFCSISSNNCFSSVNLLNLVRNRFLHNWNWKLLNFRKNINWNLLLRSVAGYNPSL